MLKLIRGTDKLARCDRVASFLPEKLAYSDRVKLTKCQSGVLFVWNWQDMIFTHLTPGLMGPYFANQCAVCTFDVIRQFDQWWHTRWSFGRVNSHHAILKNRKTRFITSCNNRNRHSRIGTLTNIRLIVVDYLY